MTKTPLGRAAGVAYDAKEDARHTLFGGTTVIQTRFYGEHKVLAVVVRTGYLTSRGALVRSILYPPPADFRFERDSYKFIGILAVIAFAGLVYTCIAKVSVPPRRPRRAQRGRRPLKLAVPMQWAQSAHPHHSATNVKCVPVCSSPTPLKDLSFRRARAASARVTSPRRRWTSSPS